MPKYVFRYGVMRTLALILASANSKEVAGGGGLAYGVGVLFDRLVNGG